jgi:hypothetical protein
MVSESAYYAPSFKPAPDPTQSGPLNWLARDTHFSNIGEQLARLTALQKLLDTEFPQLRLTVTHLEGETLICQTRGSSAAAKIRQIEPSLVSLLVLNGWKVSRIKTRPQAGPNLNGPSAAGPAPNPFARKHQNLPAPIQDRSISEQQAALILKAAQSTEDPRTKRALTMLSSRIKRR